MQLFPDEEQTFKQTKSTFTNPYAVLLTAIEELEKKCIDADVEIERNSRAREEETIRNLIAEERAKYMIPPNGS